MENKYYTPDIQDLRIGYECELWDSWAYTKENWRKITIGIQDNECSGPYPYYGLFVDYADSIDKIRTLYLTKEQIKKEGFQDIGSLWFKKEYFKVRKWKNQEIDIYINEDDLIFRGNCPSINEFRTIMKLLEIKK